MKEYAVLLNGQVIDYLRADTDRKALNLARKMFNPSTGITVELV